MNSTSRTRSRLWLDVADFPDDMRRISPRRRPASPRRPQPTLGLEGLDSLGIDIDQDPCAFAKFLELRNRI